jgi:arsenite methyltransferase
MPTTWLDTVLRQTRRAGTFPYPHQGAFLLDNPIRRRIAGPERLADALDLNGTERVLEVGPEPAGFGLRDTTGNIFHDVVRFTRLAIG